jgi:hypothetical protein
MTEDGADTIAALWRASEAELRSLHERAKLLERGVARAMARAPSAEVAAALAEVLAAQTAALDATRARTALIAAILSQEFR